MTDNKKFREVIKRHGIKIYEVASRMGMSPQALYNKLSNIHPFTQSEMAKFREMFPDVTDAEFKLIFFADELAVNDNA